MNQRHLTITLQPDWRSALRQAGVRAKARGYQGEVLNFESPGAFFSKLSEKRWALVHALRGQGEVALRQLARWVGRDVKRVHEDVHALIELGLIEKGDGGGVVCPFGSMHIDMQMGVTHAPVTLGSSLIPNLISEAVELAEESVPPEVPAPKARRLPSTGKRKSQDH